MRKILAIGICFALLLTGCSKAPQEPKPPIKIGINVWPGYAHAFIAEEKGYFKKNGVDVELILKGEYGESLELYKNGGCDGIFTLIPDILMLNSEGIMTKVVCLMDYSTTGDVIIANPKIESLTGLKGKTVSFEGVNSFSHIFVLKSLEKAGLGEADVYFKNVPAHQVLGELERGAIDAGHTWNPTKHKAMGKGYKAVASAGDISYIIVDVLAFGANIIKERPDDVRAIVKSLFEARDLIYSNKEEAAEIMSHSEGMTKEAMIDGLSGVIQPDLKANFDDIIGARGIEPRIAQSIRAAVDFYITRGQLSKEFSAGDIVEPKFIKELIEELGRD